VITVDSDERVSERRMQRICLKIPKQELTSLLIWVPIDMSVSKYTPRSRTELTDFTERVPTNSGSSRS